VLTIPINEKEDKEEEDESYKGAAESNDGKSIGSFVCEGPEIVDNVRGIGHVHVVMNHNRQGEMMGTNFTGLSSHLAFFYDPPLGPFSKFVYHNLYESICIMLIHILPFVYVLSSVLSFTDDSWEMLRDSKNQHLMIGLFHVHKKEPSTYTQGQQ
jgi:hypothetical protein